MIPGLSPEVNELYLNDPTAFAQDFLTLKGKDLNPYSYQQQVLNYLPLMEPDLEDQIRILLVLGARQIFGKSTVASMIGSWFACTHDYSESIIISHRQRRSEKTLYRIKKNYRDKPILRNMTKMGGHSDLRWSSIDVELSNEATIASLTEGNDADSAVGDSTNLVIIDEVARFKNADSIKASIMPTVFETNGVLVMLSSSWGRTGKGQYWYELIKDALDNDTYPCVNLNAIECLNLQMPRWVRTLGEERAKFLYNKKIEWLELQKRTIGRYLYDMQYMNSFETGLENVFNMADLDHCFKNKVPLHDADDGRMYINTVDFGKSVRTGDRSVLSTYDVTNYCQDTIKILDSDNKVECVVRDSYSMDYKDVIPKIVDRCVKFPGGLFCDHGGGEHQIEILNAEKDLYRRGIKPVAMISSGSMKKQSTKDFEDKGIIRKTFSKYAAILMLQTMIQLHNISYCKGCSREQYEEYAEIRTPSGLLSFNHPVGGHDDEIDTDGMCMAVLSELASMQKNVYSADAFSNTPVYGEPIECGGSYFGF